MKKLSLVLLLLIMCLSVFASCDTKTEESSVIPESKEESSQAVAESSDVTSETVSEDSSDSEEDESSIVDYVIPEFDKAKVVYNPDEEHYFDDEGRREDQLFAESTHYGLAKRFLDNEGDENDWYCVELLWFAETEEKNAYFDGIGFIKDDELTQSFKTSETDSSVVGYITKDMFEKMRKDNKCISCSWLPKKCVDNGRCVVE